MSTVTNGVRVQVTMSEETLKKYEAIALKQGKSVDTVIENQLWRFQDVESSKPLVLQDEARRHLEKTLGRNFSTADELVAYIQRSLSIHTGGVEVNCTPYLLERLRTRCIGMEFAPFVQMQVRRLLEEYVGLR
jgi:hypothetical protein